MAEKSGFFQAMWDDSLQNPITNEQTGWWDRSYLAKEFMDYFALFIGNGVFASPVNQLMVIPGAGRTIIVLTGWAFINGGWYHNDSELVLNVTVNESSTNRIDSVRLRYSESDRKINAIILNGETGVIRGDSIWDLEIAQITVTPGFTTVSAANIADMRPNGNVCGFVTGLLEVVSADSLFAQFRAIFNEWFDGVKNQVTGDLAIQLQLEFEQLNQAVVEYYNNTVTQISDYQASTEQAIEAIQTTADNAYNTIDEFVEKDFVLPIQTLTFTEKQCIISDERITTGSLVDVYFTADTMAAAEASQIYVDSSDGEIVLTASIQPTSVLKARIRVRVE